MTLGIRQRRAERERRWRVIRGLLVIGAIAALGAASYKVGAEISQKRVAGLEDEIEGLSTRERDLGERNARLEVELAETQRDLVQWQTRYDADVPAGRAHELMLQTAKLLDEGVDPDRIALMIAAAGQKLSCAGEPAVRRFFVRTPIYRGANDTVTFADSAITVTASGPSMTDANGNPESWFDPAEPVTVRFTTLGGEPSEATGKLPLHHTILWQGAEYRFAIVAADQRGFIRAAADRCVLPAR